MTARLLDLGERVAGQVLDERAWQHDDRIRPAQPHRHVVGEVCTVYPYAPHIAGVRLYSGTEVTVAVGGLRCDSCPHDPHDPGECLVGIRTADDVDGYCICGGE